ncbi:MAG: helix-hairpin-helix domain-containing protein [Candidatus Tectomicrobia bacterium]|uniref:Helix-hairpin-helix domain-containing protein n=1 Tax=Tectimicrobiota bacterium TaxID=2528274 RepID=A0A932GSV9_UNCTE|nr:helix-hairpin-helix domain-containing protein [Candidatus Tectomicrobia bacterium]
MKRSGNLKVAAIGILAVFLAFSLFSSAAAEERKIKTLDLNKATVEELAKIPGLNKQLAQAIVNYRDETGDIHALTELLKIKGINRDLLRKIQPYVNLESVGGDCTC